MNKNLFNVLEVPLEGRNVIEASAGTGKTFSISALILRLILRKKIPVENIAMVTYTNSAVSELSARVRNFINGALDYVLNGKADTEDIVKNIVDSAVLKSSPADVKTLLKKASAFLDEASIFTIHGFCRRILTEYAFETGEIFGSDLISDENDIIDRSVNKFWRKFITVKPADEFGCLYDSKISRNNLKKIISESLSGRKFIFDRKSSFAKVKKLSDKFKLESDKEKGIIDHYSNDIISKLVGGTKDEDRARSFLIRPSEKTEYNPFFTKQGTLRKSLAKKLANHPLLEYYKNLLGLEQKLKDEKKHFLFSVYNQAISYCKEEIEDYKKSKCLITISDLIDHLYSSIKNKNKAESIALKLNSRYKALFIDEFQDTDCRQYEIFTKLFPKTISFFIGDPKQSIYSFRGADLDTYLNAVKEIDNSHTYTMNTNYRSNGILIDSVNEFFSIKDPFLIKGIDYVRIQAGKKDMGVLEKKGKPCHPFSIIEPGGKDPALLAALQARDLLSGAYTIGGETVSLKKHSIGILVRKNREGERVKKALASLNIPAVLKQENKVMESDAVTEFLFFLEAAADPSEQNIKKVMLSTLLENFSYRDVAELTEGNLLYLSEFFRQQKRDFEKNGIFIICRNILNFFRLKSALLYSGRLRDLSNIQQSIEILHRKERSGAISLEETVSWIRRIREGAETTGDEYEERIESDDYSIDIATIHKSKGLDYDIVIAPYLNIIDQSGNKSNIIRFKIDRSSAFTLKGNNSDYILKAQSDLKEENRRLLYVAVTRARYKVFAVYNDPSKPGAVTPFMEQLDIKNGNPKNSGIKDVRDYFEIINFDNISGGFKKQNISDPPQKSYVKSFNRKLEPVSFTEAFTSLNAVNHKQDKAVDVDFADNYDIFTFSELKKGAVTGNFLHDIYQNADLSCEINWKRTIDRAGNKNIFIYNQNMLGNFINLLRNTAGADLPSGFSLRDIDNRFRIAEMEFFFRTSGCTDRIEKLLKMQGYTEMKLKNTVIRGAVKGFIDLVFQHKGKYYLLDWKSNHLGNSLDCYNRGNLQKAMDSNNYHLQYLLYSLALKRFLESRGVSFQNAFGGVYYLFVRGLRSGRQSGVYFTPSGSIINTIDKLDNLFDNLSVYG